MRFRVHRLRNSSGRDIGNVHPILYSGFGVCMEMMIPWNHGQRCVSIRIDISVVESLSRVYIAPGTKSMQNKLKCLCVCRDRV